MQVMGICSCHIKVIVHNHFLYAFISPSYVVKNVLQEKMCPVIDFPFHGKHNGAISTLYVILLVSYSHFSMCL